MQQKAAVVVLATGGTIAGQATSPDEHIDYVSAQLGVDTLLASVPRRAGLRLEAEQVAQVDSKDMAFAIWRALAERIAWHLVRPEVAGIVVTHGTDTMEETAWFLARVIAPSRPVVLTGAMRPATARDADGPGNLADAIKLAALAVPAGVVVAMAGEVHSARDVHKAHPRRLTAFTSGERGPVAHIDKGGIRSLRLLPEEAQAVEPMQLPATDAAWPWVEIVTSGAGVDGRVVELLVAAGVDGIVVAATGNGMVHRRLEPALAAAAHAGVAVLRSTRCLDGSVVEPTPRRPEALPSAGDLTPQKARVELIVRLLGAGVRPRRA